MGVILKLLSFAGVVAASSIFQTSCMLLSGCEESIGRETFSPNGNLVARLSVRNCGATTDYSSIVRVGSEGDLNKKEDEVFIAGGGHQIRLYWKNDATLQILCDDCSSDKVIKNLTSIHGISVVYR